MVSCLKPFLKFRSSFHFVTNVSRFCVSKCGERIQVESSRVVTRENTRMWLLLLGEQRDQEMKGAIH